MDFEVLSKYQDVRREIEKNSSLGINALVLTFPGYSVSRYFKKIAESGEIPNLKYINRRGESLEKYNLIDVDFATDADAMAIVEEYLKMASLDQKFTVLINAPWILDTYKFGNSYLGSHHYSVYRYTRPDIETLKLFAKTLGVHLTENDLKKVYKMAGGVGRLSKLLLTSDGLFKKSPEEVLKVEGVEKMIKPLVEAYGRVGKEVLTEYGVVENNIFTSSLVAEYVKIHPLSERFEIKIDKSLDLYENGEKASTLGRFETMLLEYMVENGGVITKDKISEIKWGDGEYAAFSDDAIKKTMLRLGDKMKKHKLSAIHGYGYKLIKNG